MGAGAFSRSPGRCLAGSLAVGAMWWVAFHGHDRIPVLTYVNLGTHEAGHFVTYPFSDVVTALMGSVAQVAVPLLIALYFFLFQRDWVGAGVCVAWAGTSALEVAVYVADAPTRELVLIGGTHDWAFILGPDGLDAMDKAAPLAHAIRQGASIALFTGLALCVVATLRAWRYAPAASARRATAASSPWAASATSGSAPRSASSPK